MWRGGAWESDDGDIDTRYLGDDDDGVMEEDNDDDDVMMMVVM